MKTHLAMMSLGIAVAGAAEDGAFRPGELWPDNNGVHINSHGGGVLFHRGAYYWFGQHMISFDSQSTFVLPVAGRPGAFIFMADRWRPGNAIDGRYVWLPVRFNRQGQPFLQWLDRSDLGLFKSS